MTLERISEIISTLREVDLASSVDLYEHFVFLWNWTDNPDKMEMFATMAGFNTMSQIDYFE